MLEWAFNVEMTPSASKGGNPTIHRVAFDHFRFLRNDVSGEISFADPDLLRVKVQGASLDTAPFFQLGPSKTPMPETPEKDSELPPADVQVNVDQAWVSDTGLVRGVSASLTRDAAHWHTGNIFATIREGASLSVGITPDVERRNFSIASEDAGAFLHTFDFYNNMVGGDLNIEGTIDDNDVFRGNAKISEYVIKDAPVLTRLLTVASISGVIDLLQGDGISFTTFEMPFTYADSIIVAESAKAYGPSLGITIGGHANLGAETFDFNGTLVPSYTINSLLGYIPLLGKVFVGEEGGGVLGMSYSMRGTAEDTTITVNPLSALTPGFLRNIFGIFQNSENPLEEKLKALEAETAARQSEPPAAEKVE